MITNREEILAEYPYLKEIDWMTGKQLDNRKTCLEDIPRGWRMLFLQMCDEINKLEIPEGFGFCQIKEKYGELRAYTVNTTKEIEDIINIYSLMSANICVICGKPNVPMLRTGWISPECEECFNETPISSHCSYGEVSNGESRMIPMSMKYSKWNSGNPIHYEIDISSYVNRYVEAWEKEYGIG